MNKRQRTKLISLSQQALARRRWGLRANRRMERAVKLAMSLMGQSTSRAKVRAAQRNGKLGGRPRKETLTAAPWPWIGASLSDRPSKVPIHKNDPPGAIPGASDK